MQHLSWALKMYSNKNVLRLTVIWGMKEGQDEKVIKQHQHQTG